jgi:hypothetical protein
MRIIATVITAVLFVGATGGGQRASDKKDVRRFKQDSTIRINSGSPTEVTTASVWTLAGANHWTAPIPNGDDLRIEQNGTLIATLTVGRNWTLHFDKHNADLSTVNGGKTVKFEDTGKGYNQPSANKLQHDDPFSKLIVTYKDGEKFELDPCTGTGTTCSLVLCIGQGKGQACPPPQ